MGEITKGQIIEIIVDSAQKYNDTSRRKKVGYPTLASDLENTLGELPTIDNIHTFRAQVCKKIDGVLQRETVEVFAYRELRRAITETVLFHVNVALCGYHEDLIRFFKSRTPGPWKKDDLRTWGTPENPAQGKRMMRWISRNLIGGSIEKTVATMLGEKAKILASYRFEEEHGWLPHKIRSTLVGFLYERHKSHKDSSWSPSDLVNSGKGRANLGTNLANAIRSEYGDISEETVRKILGKEADQLLARTPFKKIERLTDEASEQKYLKETKKQLVAFVEALPYGEWGRGTFKERKRKGLLDRLEKIRKLKKIKTIKETIIMVLGDEHAVLLAHKPFRQLRES